MFATLEGSLSFTCLGGSAFRMTSTRSHVILHVEMDAKHRSDMH